jgi:hypothetical protein
MTNLNIVELIIILLISTSILPAQDTTVSRQTISKFKKMVKVEFPEDGYTFTVGQAKKGIKIKYKVIITQDFPGVITLPDGPSFRDPPGASVLYPREQIDGHDQLYCLKDYGLAKRPAEIVRTLKKGTYQHSFEWDGRNWSGPSDFQCPKGKAFPTGTYELTISVVGKLITAKGFVPYSAYWKTTLVLKKSPAKGKKN